MIQNPPAPTRDRRWMWLLLIPFAAAILLVLAVLGHDSRVSADQAAAAETTCHTEVLAHLKSPGSAKFTPAAVTVAAGQTADFYTVSGQVDSQNGFGALLRSTYRCDVTLERDGTWRVSTVVVG